MSRDAAIEMMDFNPFLAPLPDGFSGPRENRRVKDRVKQYVSIGFYRDLDAPDGLQMRYYLYEDRHKRREDIKTYTSLVDLERGLQTDAHRGDIFRNNPKLFSLSTKKRMLQQISETPKILKIDDLKIIDDFPSEEFCIDRAIALAQIENDILTKEKDSYIRLVQTILDKGDAADHRDILELALGLKDYAEKGSIEDSVFEGYQAFIDDILANRRLLELVMVTCGKVLIVTPNNDRLIDLLRSKDISVNSVDEHGMTALHYAVQNFYVYRAEPLHLVKKLLDCGANVELADKAGHTPFSLAMEHGSKGMVMGGQQLIELTTASSPPAKEPEKYNQYSPLTDKEKCIEFKSRNQKNKIPDTEIDISPPTTPDPGAK